MESGQSLSTNAHSIAANSPPPDGIQTLDDSLGDLLSELLRTLPSDASALFLRSLSGLSPTESHHFCEYIAKLKPEKQFRVIYAMSGSTLDGKRKFLMTLEKKIKQQQQKEQELEKTDMESQTKRKQALIAAERVRKLNAGANKFHSFNAAVGAGVIIEASNAPSTPSDQPSSQQHTNTSPITDNDVLNSVGRSMSSSSVITTITKEDIQQVGSLLKNTFITESELNLRELEVTKKAFASNATTTIDMMDASKRDRPQSTHDLMKDEHKPLQRSRVDGIEIDTSNYSSSTNNTQKSNYSNSTNCSRSTNPTHSVPDHHQIEDDEEEDPEAPSTKRWTKLQDNALRESVRVHGEKNWKAIAELVPGRNHAQCLQRWRKVLKPGLVKGHWSFEEDQILEYLVTQGCNIWGQIAERIPGRTPKQCRERWKNHLDPAINKGPYTKEEDEVILDAQSKLGNKWSQIAQLLQGRTEDSVKIRWKSLQQNPTKAQQKKTNTRIHRGYTPPQKLRISDSGLQQRPLYGLQPSSLPLDLQPSLHILGNVDLNQIKTETRYNEGFHPYTSPSYEYTSNTYGYPSHSSLIRTGGTGGMTYNPSTSDYGVIETPPSYWNPYHKTHSSEPISLSTIPQPSPHHQLNTIRTTVPIVMNDEEEDGYDEHMFETLATELESQTLHFAPL